MQTATIRLLLLFCLVLAAPSYSKVGATYHAHRLVTAQLRPCVCICRPVRAFFVRAGDRRNVTGHIYVR